jgi:hypothetical protein
LLGARFQLTAYNEWKNKRLESRIFFITRESYNDITAESHKLLKDFMEDMKKIYKDKQEALICELAIEDDDVIGGAYHWKLLETLEEEL